MLSRRVPRLCALALSLVLAAPAVAQEPTVDPNSPAGTEYQLPTDRARDEASGGATGARGSSAGEAPLFGAGVGEKRSSSGSGGMSRKDSHPAGAAAQVQPGLATRTPATVRAQAGAPDGGGSGLAVIAAGAGGVLLLGGLAGLAWRRRSVRG